MRLSLKRSLRQDREHRHFNIQSNPDLNEILEAINISFKKFERPKSARLRMTMNEWSNRTHKKESLCGERLKKNTSIMKNYARGSSSSVSASCGAGACASRYSLYSVFAASRAS